MEKEKKEKRESQKKKDRVSTKEVKSDSKVKIEITANTPRRKKEEKKEENLTENGGANGTNNKERKKKKKEEGLGIKEENNENKREVKSESDLKKHLLQKSDEKKHRKEKREIKNDEPENQKEILKNEIKNEKEQEENTSGNSNRKSKKNKQKMMQKSQSISAITRKLDEIIKEEKAEPFSDFDSNFALENFQVVSLLGVGAQGRVYLVKLKGTDHHFAMKVFKKDKIITNEKTIRSILTEQRFLATSQHPFVTKLFYSFHSYERLYMVMEYCAGGELFTLIRRQPSKRLTEEQIRFYSSEVLLVLEFVHSKGYIYRDLKPENILLHSDGHIRMADFGLSKQSELPPSIQLIERKEKKLFGKQKVKLDLNLGEVLRTNSLVGSIHYLAPEVFVNQDEGYDIMADWWAFGVLLYDMLCGFPPFYGQTNEEIIIRILHCEYFFPDDVFVNAPLKSLIKTLLQVNPKKRLGSKHGTSDIKNHPFYEGTNWGLLRHRTPPLIPKIDSITDTSNFMLYEDDRDEIDFTFFSELPDNENVGEEYMKSFSAFNFKSDSFSQFTPKQNNNNNNNNNNKQPAKRKREKKKIISSLSSNAPRESKLTHVNK